ncbi:MAG: DAK2 domain-containing protein, partial [Desulfobacteraceae bacterium]|nr:DAK2 domain-containing protein [Desulfobacteraceae bacterium]
MKQHMFGTGKQLKEMFHVATAWLENNAMQIDAINVFPVPDGDCGKNMLLTMRSAMESANGVRDPNASSVIKAIARGALIGARGNSGVILSQILKGVAEGLEGKETFTARDLAQALAQGAKTAYRALSQPVEGTILTVIRDVATAAGMAVDENPEDLESMFEAAVNAAKQSVDRTPLLLPILREAGVVDAGGQGLYVLLDGMLRYLKGETKESLSRAGALASTFPLPREAVLAAADVGERYGYCTQFLIEGEKLNPDQIGRKLARKGSSLMVVGDESNVRIH